jgi:hypothetical protein
MTASKRYNTVPQLPVLPGVTQASVPPVSHISIYSRDSKFYFLGADGSEVMLDFPEVVDITVLQAKFGNHTPGRYLLAGGNW